MHISLPYVIFLHQPMRRRPIFFTYGIFYLCMPGWRANFYRTVVLMGMTMTKDDTTYGAIRTTEELGRLVRAHRKSRRLTIETDSGLGNLSTRFLSECERGKETAEIGKVLKALRTLGLEIIIQPRGSTAPSSLSPTKARDEVS